MLPQYSLRPTRSTSAGFLRRHPASEHPYLEVVHLALARGQCQPESEHSAVGCDELLPTYRVRAKTLRRFQTPHAIELRREVEGFCSRLAASRGKSAQFFGFRLPENVHYLFVERTDTYELLAAMRTVSKLDVTQDEWQRLWGDDKS
jgi:hypothetical protein